MNEDARQTQAAILAAAKRRGVTRDSYAAALGFNAHSQVSFMASKSRFRDMTVADLLTLFDHMGDPEAVADVLRVLGRSHGVVVRTQEEDERASCAVVAARETSEALAVLLHPDTPAEKVAKECREAAVHLQLVADNASVGA